MDQLKAPRDLMQAIARCRSESRGAFGEKIDRIEALNNLPTAAARIEQAAADAGRTSLLEDLVSGMCDAVTALRLINSPSQFIAQAAIVWLNRANPAELTKPCPWQLDGIAEMLRKLASKKGESIEPTK